MNALRTLAAGTAVLALLADTAGAATVAAKHGRTKVVIHTPRGGVVTPFGGQPMSISDGSDVAEGAKADTATCTPPASVSGCLKQLDADVKSPIPAGTAVIGYTSADPCAQLTKSTADFSSTTSGGSVITASASNKAYICSITIISSKYASISLIEGTGSSVCTGGTPAAVYGNTGVTAANGMAIGVASTNDGGGLTIGNGGYTIAKSGTVNYNTCALFTTTNSPQVNFHVSYVNAP